MVRPEETPTGESSCVELAGESPVAVSTEAPRSRLRVRYEINSPERSVESPHESRTALAEESEVAGPM